MLRGLFIRRTFITLDWVLGILIVAGGGYAFMRFMGPVGANADPALAGAASEVPGSMIAKAGARADYDRIVASGLFGSSGQVRQEKPAPAPEPEAEETQLRLKLCGTAATSPRDLYASAVILNEEDNSVRSFGVGQAVVENVTLEEVYPRKVILFNKRNNRREVLRSEESKETEAKAGASPSNRVTVKKEELVQELFTNYADIVTQIKPEMYHDAEGNVAGITASNIGSIPIAQKLGIRDGDILQTVNNEPIDSQQKIIEMVNKYRNSNTFRIGILRDGKPTVITYKLD